MSIHHWLQLYNAYNLNKDFTAYLDTKCNGVSWLWESPYDELGFKFLRKSLQLLSKWQAATSSPFCRCFRNLEELLPMCYRAATNNKKINKPMMNPNKIYLNINKQHLLRIDFLICFCCLNSQRMLEIKKKNMHAE